MKRIVMSLAVLALVTTAGLAGQWLDTDVEGLIESAPDKESYPDAAAIFLAMQEMAEVAEDGSVVTTRNRLIKVLTLRGRERYSNQSFLYNTEFSLLSLIKGVTVTKMGRCRSPTSLSSNSVFDRAASRRNTPVSNRSTTHASTANPPMITSAST